MIVFSPRGYQRDGGRRHRPHARVERRGRTAGVTTVDPSNTDVPHRWPHFLPDGRHFLFTEISGVGCLRAKPSVIKVGSLDPTEALLSCFRPSHRGYASGHVVFARDGILMAQPFDPETRRSTGEAFPLAEDVAGRAAAMSASRSLRTARWCTAATAQSAGTLTWLDRTGRALRPSASPRGTSTSRCHLTSAAWRLRSAPEIWRTWTTSTSGSSILLATCGRA